jgi:hypothetical protein
VQKKPDAPVVIGMYPRRVNGLPGFVLDYGGGELAVFAVEVHAGVIAAIYLVANPDKLTRVSPRPD